jgi:hypothetical protein
MKRPFEVLAVGLVSETRRGNKTDIELFVQGVEVCRDDVKRLVVLA